jgi:hypothetical protein
MLPAPALLAVELLLLLLLVDVCRMLWSFESCRIEAKKKAFIVSRGLFCDLCPNSPLPFDNFHSSFDEKTPVARMMSL